MSGTMDVAEQMMAEETARYNIINETINVGTSPVQQFYSGAVVLVTGGSGFLGKQLIEKLFRSTKIEKLYMVLRQKKKKTIEERMNSFFEEPVCEYLNKTQPDFRKKVVPIMGDMTEIKLGISDEDWDTITKDVTMIFHGAATTNFTEPLKLASLTNVRGTREIIKLAKDCKNLKSFVYISTAYSHATYEHIKKPVLEKFYDSPMSPEALLQLVDSFDSDRLDDMTPELIKNWPNTYSFTKAIAEETVRTMAADLPTCVVRPAIVICSKREPSPGWIDMSCVFGASGIVVGAGLGVVRTLFAVGDIKLDLVPVDIVNNAVIVAAHETAVRWGRGDTETKIYTVTGTRNPVTMGGMMDIITAKGGNISSDKAIWYPYTWRTNNRLIYFILSWFLHYIPGYLVDGILNLLGKPPMLSKVYNKMGKLTGALEYYTSNDWLFDDSNLLRLYWKLSPTDRTIYECNMKPMDWERYFLFWCIGCRKYIVKDGLKNTAYAIKKRSIFKILNVLVLSLYAYIFYTMAYYLYSIFYYLVYLVV